MQGCSRCIYHGGFSGVRMLPGGRLTRMILHALSLAKCLWPRGRLHMYSVLLLARKAGILPESYGVCA